MSKWTFAIAAAIWAILVVLCWVEPAGLGSLVFFWLCHPVLGVVVIWLYPPVARPRWWYVIAAVIGLVPVINTWALVEAARR